MPSLLLSWSLFHVAVTALVAVLVMLVAFGAASLVRGAWRARQPQRPAPLPPTWDLRGRPVFTSEERLVFHRLRTSLPDHVILAKLPLVRLCQSEDPAKARYWFDLLGTAHVSFAVCNPSGRVLTAIDVIDERPVSERQRLIKESTLATCKVRYLRCTAQTAPSPAELQVLVPPVVPHATLASTAAGEPPAAHPTDVAAAYRPDNRLRERRRRSALWQDSRMFTDSFFAPDPSGGRGSGFGAFDVTAPTPAPPATPAAIPSPAAAEAGREPVAARPLPRTRAPLDFVLDAPLARSAAMPPLEIVTPAARLAEMAERARPSAT